MTERFPDEWGPHLAEMKRDPEFLAAYEAAAQERLLTEADWHRGQVSSTGSDSGSHVILWVLAAAVVGWSVLIVGAVWYAIRWWA